MNVDHSPNALIEPKDRNVFTENQRPFNCQINQISDSLWKFDLKAKVGNIFSSISCLIEIECVVS